MANNELAASIAEDLRSTFIKLPRVVRILDRATQLIDTNWGNSEPDPLVVLGETGLGKSTLLKHILSKHPRIEHETFSEIPVLYVEVPARSTIPRLSGEMLKSIGLPFQIKGDDGEAALVTLIRECRIKLVILDEMNHMVDRGRSRTHYNVGDWVKQMSHKAGASFLLAGTPRAANLLKTNEQLGDRFAEVVSLRPLAGKEFSAALKVFQAHLDRVDSVDLTSPALLKLMAFATGGRLRAIRRLLVRAVEMGLRSTDSRIDVSVLSQAFSEVIYADAPSSRNPFSAKFNGHPLTKAGEPFAPRAEYT